MSTSYAAATVAPYAAARRNSSERRWAAGAHVVVAGTATWLLVDGTILLRRAAEHGSSLVLEIIGPGAVLAPTALPEATYLQAATDIGLRRLSRSQAMAGLLHRVASLHERSMVVAYGSAHQRVAWLLTRLAGDAAGEILLPMLQTEMASYLGLTPETIARTLTLMRQRGLLGRVQRGMIEVLRPTELRAVHEAPLRRRRPRNAGAPVPPTMPPGARS
jgi:CRP-like cAMP-binding protein